MLELALGRAARDDGRTEDAIAHLSRAADADAGAIAARKELAELLLAQGRDLPRAAVLVAEAERLAPRDASLQRLAGHVCELRGDDAGAADAYGRALSSEPDPELRLRRGQILQRLGRTDEAVRELEEVARRRPSDRAARDALAQLYEAQGRLLDAERALIEVAALGPSEPAPQRRLAAFYRRHGAAAKAADAERRARSLQGAPRILRPLRPSKH